MSGSKSINTLMIVFMMGLLAFPLAGSASAAGQPIATLTEFTGEVIVKTQGSWAGAAVVGMPLYANDQIATREGTATVTFDDGGVMNIDRNSNSIIEQWQEEKGTTDKVATVKRRIMLLLGKLGFRSGSLGSNTMLSTVTAVCGLRGTAGTLSIAEDGTPMITFTEGGRSYTLGELIDGVAEDVPTETASFNPLQWASFLSNAIAAVAGQTQAQLAQLKTDRQTALADSPLTEVPDVTNEMATKALSAYWAARTAQEAANSLALIARTLVQNNPDPAVVGKYSKVLASAEAASLAAQEAVAAAITELERLGIPIPDDPSPFILGPTFNVDPEPGLDDMTASPA